MKGYEAVRLARRQRQPNGKPIPAGTARVLEALADHVGDNNGLDVWPSEETLAEEVGRSRRRVRGHLAKLVSWGLIERRRRGKRGEGGGGRDHNVHRLTFLEASNRTLSTELPDTLDRSNRTVSTSNRTHGRPEETTEGINEETKRRDHSLGVLLENNSSLPSQNGNGSAAGSPSPRRNGGGVRRGVEVGASVNGDRPHGGVSSNGTSPYPAAVSFEAAQDAKRREDAEWLASPEGQAAERRLRRRGLRPQEPAPTKQEVSQS